MSYHSDHMNHPIGGGLIRAGMSYVKIDKLFTLSKEQLRTPDPQHYGNTKWGDHVILYFYIVNNFEKAAGAKDLGTNWTNFVQRLGRINAMLWMEMTDGFKRFYPNQLTVDKLIIQKKQIGRRVSTLEVAAALAKTNGNAREAAKLLGCSVTTIYSKRMGIKD